MVHTLTAPVPTVLVPRNSEWGVTPARPVRSWKSTTEHPCVPLTHPPESVDPPTSLPRRSVVSELRRVPLCQSRTVNVTKTEISVAPTTYHRRLVNEVPLETRGPSETGVRKGSGSYPLNQKVHKDVFLRNKLWITAKNLGCRGTGYDLGSKRCVRKGRSA